MGDVSFLQLEKETQGGKETWRQLRLNILIKRLTR